jgi:hypothetical protein
LVESTNHTTASTVFDKESDDIPARSVHLPWTFLKEEILFKQSLRQTPLSDSYPITIAAFSATFGTVMFGKKAASGVFEVGVDTTALLRYDSTVQVMPMNTMNDSHVKEAKAYLRNRMPPRFPLPLYNGDPRAGIPVAPPAYLLHSRSRATEKDSIRALLSNISSNADLRMKESELVLFNDPLVVCTEYGFYPSKDTSRSISSSDYSGKRG